MDNSTKITKVNLYSLKLILEVDGELHLMSSTLSPNINGNPTLELLLEKYQDLFR